MAVPTVVPIAVRNELGSTNSAPSYAGSVDIATRHVAPSGGDRESNPGSMEGVWRSVAPEQVSVESSDLFSEAWRPGTKKSYISSWNQWDRWCSERGLDPVQASLASVIDFITKLYNKGLAYRTINTYRSAISTFHDLIDGFKVGQHPMIKTQMRAIFNKRTPQPRYLGTWDVNVVLSYIADLSKTDLSDKDLTLKLTMLLALTSRGRSSEIHALCVSRMSHFGNHVKFVLNRPSKTTKVGQDLPVITFFTFGPDSKLCVINCLDIYLKRTEAWRACNDGYSRDQLLLSFKKPHRPVVSCSVARWLKGFMSQAGINTAIFKAHSTRSAAVSKAKNAGVSTNDIMKQANWSKASTFHRFYNRSRDTDRAPCEGVFQSRVLST